MARETIDIIIQERGSRRVAGNIREIGNSADASQGRVLLLRRALGGLAGAFSIRAIAQTLDSYQRMQNQLRVVGYETDQLGQAMDRLYGIAQKTRTPLEETVNLYGKLAQSAGELGKSEQEMLRFTELTGKALAIQGTGLAGSRAALLQLSQAMGEGIVRAQEYNSLVENARPLLLAAAHGLDAAGGSVAKLRTEVIEGRVTSEQFFDAVMKGGEMLDEQFGKTVPTIAQALTVLNNAWTKWIGESQLGQTVLAAVSNSIIFLANNMDTLASVVIGVGAAFVAWTAGGLLSRMTMGVGALTGSIRMLTAAIAANPLGALLVVGIALGTVLYNLRDRMVTLGENTASVGNIVAVLWERLKTGAANAWEAFKTFYTNMVEWGRSAFTTIADWFADMGITAKDVGNFLIAVFKSSIDAIIGNFRVLYQVAIAVLQGIANVGGGIMKGLGAAITGDFKEAGAAFSEAFSLDNFNFDNVVAEARGVATTIGDNFGRDFLGEAGAALERGKGAFTDAFSGVMRDAAARTVEPGAIEEMIFEKIGGGVSGADGGKSKGKGKSKTKELTDLQKAYKEIVDETRGSLKELVIEQKALDMALANGVINQNEFTVKQQEIRQGLAEWATEAQNAAGAIRETNQAILQLKIDSGQGTFADGFLLGLDRMTQGAQNFTANAGTLFSDFFTSFTDGFANSVGRAIVYSEDLGEALMNVANEALASLISGLVKMGVQWLLNAVIGQSVAQAATAATAAQASAAAAAWAPAAALASLATSGANAAPAAAAIGATTALSAAVAATSGAAAAFADGGQVRGPGGPRDDKIAAWLSNGEYVVNAKAAQANLGLLEMINSGKTSKAMVMPKFAMGGEVKQQATNRVANGATRDINAVEKAQPQQAGPSNSNVEVPVKVVNVTDPNAAIEALQTSKGERTILNILENNPETVKALLRS